MADPTAKRQRAEQALDVNTVRPKVSPSAEAKGVYELEHELAPKERALAEAGALLVLKPEAHKICGSRTMPGPR